MRHPMKHSLLSSSGTYRSPQTTESNNNDQTDSDSEAKKKFTQDEKDMTVEEFVKLGH